MSDNQYEGFVEKISLKQGNKKDGSRWFKYSVKLDNDQPWVSMPFNKEPSFKEGDYVRFDANTNAKGYIDIVPGTGEIVAKPPRAREQASKSTGSVGGAVGSADGYWQQKFDYEVNLVGPRVALGYARRDALSFLEFAFAHDALPLTGTKTKAGQATRYDQLISLLDKVTLKFYLDGNDISRIIEGAQDERDAGAEEVADVPEPAQVSAQVVEFSDLERPSDLDGADDDDDNKSGGSF